MSATKSVSMMFSGNGELPSQKIGEFSAEAESKGFDGVWFGETTLRDASVLATVAALKTRRIRVGTSILNIFTRSPSQLALMAATISELSGGRFTLGLGVSTAAIVETWHGQKFRAPMARLEETVALLRQYFSGERFSYSGVYSSPTAARLRTGPVPQIALAALNDGMVRKAGALADRVILNLYPAEEIGRAITLLEEGSGASGRQRPIVSVMLYAIVAEAGEKGLEAAKELISFYASAPAYSALFSRLGYVREAKSMMDAWKEKDRDAVKRIVSPQMIERMIVLGNIKDLRARVQEYQDAGVDDVFICPSPFGDYEANITEVLHNYY